MKKCGYILFLALFSTGAFQQMPIQSNTEPSDSPKESDFNCEVPSLIFSPKKKVFEPGTTLTASMPVFTPAPIDKEILIPGYDFQK